MGAEDLGKRLLAEVEEVGLGEVLNILRLDESSTTSCFGLTALDALLQTATEAKTSAPKAQPSLPIVELMSTAPASGKTHLLYHLTAHAVLPTHLGGRQSSVILLDLDDKFSIPRLVQQLTTLMNSHPKRPKDHPALQETITTSLKHIHTFHPQSLPSTIATLNSLPSYLFNANRHHSFDRPIGFIALDSASVFYYQAKTNAEHAALLNKQHPQQNGYIQLAAALKNTCRIFNTPAIFTCWNMGPAKKTTIPAGFGMDERALRPSLPPPWQTLPTLRLGVRRVPVRKLPVEIGLEEALRESEMRQKVAEQGRFECFVNEWGMDERAMQKLRERGGGFEFRILRDGVYFGDGDA